MKYLAPEIEIIKFDNTDVIQTSGGTGEGDNTGGNSGNSGNNENQTPELEW